MTSTLKPRFEHHNLLNDQVMKDWIFSINNDPENYQALLYIPHEPNVDTSDDGLFEAELYTQLDNNQDDLTYKTPILVNVVDAKTAEDSFYLDQDGEEGYGDDGEIHMVKVAHEVIPTGSILEWEESTGGGDKRRVWWYVENTKSIGTQKAGVVYLLIPCRDFNRIVTVDEQSL